MICRLCGKFSFENKCIYCGTSFDKTHRVSSNEERKSLPKVVSVPFVQPKTNTTINQEPDKNNMAVAGFVLSMIGYTFLLGLIFSIIGLKKSFSKNGKGRGFAIAGIIIGLLPLVSGTIITIILIMTYDFL